VPARSEVRDLHAVSFDGEPTLDPATRTLPGVTRPSRQEIRAEIFRYADAPSDCEFRGKCGFASGFAYSS
jgi:hypothetical protein